MTPLVAIFKIDISKGTPEVVVIELPDIDLKLPVVGIGCVKEAVGLQSRYISSPTFSALADSFIDRFEAEDRVALTNLLLVGIFTRVVTVLLPVPKFTISSTFFLSSADIYPAVVEVAVEGGNDRDIGKGGINNTGNGGAGGRGGRDSFSRQKSTYGGSGIIVLHYFKYK